MSKGKAILSVRFGASCVKVVIGLLCIVFSLVTVRAQNYPVDINLQILPPQSPAFHTYSQSQAIQTNKILLSASLKDLVVPTLDIGFSFEFRGPNGAFTTDPSLINLPFTIQQGVPLMLSNSDLSNYFLSPDLSQNITDANGFMPEGEWEVCVTAYELLNQEQVSRQTCFYMFLENYDPPQVIEPFDSILPSFPQNIQLTWQPLHIAAFPVTYDVEIWESLEGFTDQQIVDLTPPYYYKTVDQITSTFLTAVDLPLTVGSEYLMRVQVSDNVNGMMGLPVYVFKNQGYSNLHRFKYGMVIEGQKCEDPSVPEYVVDDSLDMYVFWNDGEPPAYEYEEPTDDVNESQNAISLGGLSARESLGGGGLGGFGGGISSSSSSGTQPIYSDYYKMYFRDVTDGVEGEWNFIETQEEWALFEEYTRGHEYDIYISVVCSAEERRSESIFVKFAKLPPPRDFSCGMPALDIDLSKQRPLSSLAVDDTIIAGDMRVIVLDVQGSNGYFSGSGYMKPPVFGTRIGLTFNNIFVNNEFRMIDGEMKTMYDPTGSNIADISGWKDFFPGNDEPFPIIEMQAVTDASFVDGKVIVYPGGDTYEAPIRVRTPEGDVILSGGMIIRAVEVDLPDGIASGYEGKFSPSEIHRYGFDPVDPKLSRFYEEFGGVALDNKSVAKGGSDFLNLTLTQVPDSWTSSSADSLRIISEEKFELQYERLGEKEIKIKMAGLEGDEIIYVIKGEQCLAAFNLVPYTKTIYKVNLVPVNGAGINVSASEIEASVNAILKQGVVAVEVTLLSAEEVTDDEGVIEADTDVLDAYSDHMRSILQRHKDLFDQEENEMYLFMVEDIEGAVVGAMPEGMNAGFIDVGEGASELSRTIAHELGHGAFTLEHFWKKTDYAQGGSKNLMDYSGGNDLVLNQWNRMHNQRFPLPWFKKGEDGQYKDHAYFEKVLQQIRCGYAQGLASIPMPEKFLDGTIRNEIAGFDYGFFNSGFDPETAKLNGYKISSADWTLLGTKPDIIGELQSPKLNRYTGTITYANFEIDVPIKAAQWNDKPEPFDHFVGYLTPTQGDIDDDFSFVWNEMGIGDKVKNGETFSENDMRILKSVASCGLENLANDERIGLVKILLKSKFFFEEYYEDLLLDILESTPKGEDSKKLYSDLIGDVLLMEELYKDLHDSGIFSNEKNYTRFGIEIARLYDKAYTKAEKDALYDTFLDENRHIYHGDFGGSCDWKIKSDLKGETINFTETIVLDKQVDGLLLNNGISGYTCDLLINKFSYNISDVIALSRDGEKARLLPAISYHIMIRAQANENLREKAATIWLIVTTVTPFDEFYLLGKAFGLVQKGFKATKFSNIKEYIRSKGKLEIPESTASKNLLEEADGKLDNFVVITKAGGKARILAKLADLPFARSFVNSLDEVADAGLLTRIDELGDVKLQSLDKFYKNRQSPSGFTIDEFNFPATKYFDEKPVTINFRKGMPDLRDHSPVMNFTDGTPSGKFKFESNSLNGKTADFTAANTALAKKFGIEKIGGNWPKNAQGFVQKGNYRWNPSKTYFDVFDPSTQKWVRQTWHHFEDGTTMFPVSSKIHSNPGGFSHSGGKSIIDNGLQNIFEFLGF